MKMKIIIDYNINWYITNKFVHRVYFYYKSRDVFNLNEMWIS